MLRPIVAKFNKGLAILRVLSFSSVSLVPVRQRLWVFQTVANETGGKFVADLEIPARNTRDFQIFPAAMQEKYVKKTSYEGGHWHQNDARNISLILATFLQDSKFA